MPGSPAEGRVVHFLLHVPKCAGSTVEHHFARHLGAAFLIAPRWESVWRNVLGNRRALSPGAAEGVRAVSGHSLSLSMKAAFPGAEIRESVLLRDPVGYFLSFYNYRWMRFAEGWGPEPARFALWYAVQRKNPISRFLLNRYFEQGVPALYRLSSAGRLAWLEARLAEFWFVGGHRRVDTLIAAVARDLGVPEAAESRNVTPVRHETAESLGPALCARIAAENALDQALHDRWEARGFTGAPGFAPRLARADQPRYLAADTLSSLAKRLV